MNSANPKAPQFHFRPRRLRKLRVTIPALLETQKKIVGGSFD
jgi:hypothetical protein